MTTDGHHEARSDFFVAALRRLVRRRFVRDGCGGLRGDRLRGGLSWRFFVLVAAEFQLHDATDFEFDGTLFRYLDPLEGLWILRDAGGADLALEDAEVPEFQTVALPEFVDDLIQKVLNDALDVDTFVARSVGDSIDQLFFGHGSHGGTR